ncbi:MAG: nitroreductase family protein [Syntrophomonadaceae bacterium]|jgi:NAD-dependent dihydropyrimidine dehydrogenase PreA subunit/nitroreductase
MAIKTGRADKSALVSIDYDRCTACGLCVQVCKGAPLHLENQQVMIDLNRIFGCLGCGHCAAICPMECIKVKGRELSPDDLFPLPTMDSRADYQQLHNLLFSRRSIREFQEQEVESEKIKQIIDSVSTAPMGLPPSDVEILVIRGREKVRQLSWDIIDYFRNIRWIFSPAARLIMRPLLGKEYDESASTFLAPAIDFFIEQKEKGNDYLLYDAPLAMYFHTSPYADPADPIVAATYAMITAETLGLGSCMIGTVAYGFKYSKRLKEKYGIPARNQQGIMLIMGYPAIQYRRGIKRSLAKITYY